MFGKKVKVVGGIIMGILLYASTATFAQGDVQFDQALSNIEFNQFSQGGNGFFDIVDSGGQGAATAKNAQESLNLVQFGFGDIGNNFEAAAEAGIAEQIDDKADVPPAVEGKALFYPSPFSMRSGGTLGYKLSKPMEIEIRMYDMMANLVYKNTFAKGSNGGSDQNNNKIRFSSQTFDGFELSAGVYFYMIIHNGQVLAKGKVGVVP